MKYDFDELVERRGTGCVKWDAEAPRSTGLASARGQFRV